MKHRSGLIALLAVLAAGLIGAQATSAGAADTGRRAVFVQTNQPAGNQIAVYDQAADGTLSPAGTYATGGNGGAALPGTESDRLASQSSLAYDAEHKQLIAVNAGSDTVSAFRVEGDQLTLEDVLPSGGQFPASVGVHNDLAYVLNSGGTGIVQGFLITKDGLESIPGSARSLGLANTEPPNFIYAIGVQPSGGVLIVGNFARVGGGTARDDIRNRPNFARLIGGSTPGPGNIELAYPSYTADQSGESLFITMNRVNGSLGQAAVSIRPDPLPSGPGSAVDGEDFLFDLATYGTPTWITSWADGGGGTSLWLPGSGSRKFEDPDGYVKMNGREVFKFATRVMVSSADAILGECGKTVDDVDVYVPHQANVRIIDHAARKLGVPHEKTVINVDRYGNTSSGSIPLALADAADDGRLGPGKLVLLTGMGAGLTWGSALIEWTHETTGAAA